MSANEMNPRKITSSFSKREKMRRNPFNAGTASLFRCVSCTSPVVLPRMNPGAEGRNNGSEPKANASWRVSLPSYARSINRYGF